MQERLRSLNALQSVTGILDFDLTPAYRSIAQEQSSPTAKAWFKV
jgi:hypothetical protein